MKGNNDDNDQQLILPCVVSPFAINACQNGTFIQKKTAILKVIITGLSVSSMNSALDKGHKIRTALWICIKRSTACHTAYW